MVRQILYISVTTEEMGEGELEGILKTAYNNNLQHKITGLLLYAGKHFMQAIEGPPEAVGQLFHNIQHDSRNKNVKMLFDRTINKRCFPAWLMGFSPVSAKDLSELTGLRIIRTTEDLEAIEFNDKKLFNYMQSFYVNNAGLFG